MKTSTLGFLRGLAANNDKTWFDAHRSEYENARADFLSFLTGVLQGLSEKDPGLAGLEPKACLFRINRDVRFSANKAPYKNNLGAFLCKGGKKSSLAGYYLHLEPGAAFMGGGLWMPEAPALAKVRQEIDYCLGEFQGILRGKGFRDTYGTLEDGHRLTRLPKGYEAGNPAEEYIRLKSFTAVRPVSDEELTSKDAVRLTVKGLNGLVPLIGFLNRALEATD